MKPNSKAIAVAVDVFRRLLVLYPRQHRQEFGEDMVQVFRDQCREVFGTGRWDRVAAFLGRTVWDLMRTSVMEHTTSMRTTLAMRPSFVSRIAAVLAGAAVFFVILGTVALVLSLMPATYMSTARLQVPLNASIHDSKAFDPFYLQTQVERLVSRAVLYPVIEELALNQSWSHQYLRDGTLKTAETYEILRDRIEVRQVRKTTMLEVRVFDQDKSSAAQIANKVVEVYRDQIAAETGGLGMRVMVVDLAEPGLRAVRPNWPMGLSIGALVACLVAVVTTGGLWWIGGRLTPAG